MAQTNNFVTSGIPDLDRLLGGGIIIGDDVIWYDDAGLLASVFCLNLLQASKADCKHLIYLSFDCSPRHLLENRNRYFEGSSSCLIIPLSSEARK